MAEVTAISSLGWAHYTLYEALPRMAARGFQRVEIASFDSYCFHFNYGSPTPRELKVLLADAGLEIVGLNFSAGLHNAWVTEKVDEFVRAVDAQDRPGRRGGHPHDDHGLRRPKRSSGSGSATRERRVIDPTFAIVDDPLMFHWNSTSRPIAAPPAIRGGYVVFSNDTAGASALTQSVEGEIVPTLYYLRAVRTPTVMAGAGGGQAAGVDVLGNGDVNGDNAINVSDVIDLLAYLFRGGDAPRGCPVDGETICDDGDGDTDCDDSDCICASLLPATGQTNCYDENGGEIDCAGTGQDGESQTGGKGTKDDPRFILDLGPDGMLDDGNRPVDDTIIDNCTGLQWQATTADTNGNGTTLNDDDDLRRWCDPDEPSDALGYIDALDFAGHADWRLPNLHEVSSLMNYGSPTGIDAVFGTRTSGLSSTTVTNSNTIY